MVENMNPVGAVLGRLGESQNNDQVTERWAIGQQRRSEAFDDSEMEETSQSYTNTVSLNRSTSTVQTSVGSPEPSCSHSSANNTQAASLPSSPSLGKSEETFNSLPSNITNSAEKQKPDSDLQSENARLKEQRTCKICMDGEVGVVFLPCGHLCCCVNCAPALKDCPVCRTTIQGTVRTFLS